MVFSIRDPNIITKLHDLHVHKYKSSLIASQWEITSWHNSNSTWSNELAYSFVVRVCVSIRECQLWIAQNIVYFENYYLLKIGSLLGLQFCYTFCNELLLRPTDEKKTVLVSLSLSPICILFSDAYKNSGINICISFKQDKE